MAGSKQQDDRPAAGADAAAGEIERLRAENDRLRAELAARSTTARPAPVAPSFGMSEGTREELERTGKATDPFTGEALTRDDLK